MSPTRPCPQSHIFRDVYINISIAATNGHTCGGEQSGRASEKKGHGGGSWLFLAPGGLEQQVGSKMPTCTLQCRGHITGAAPHVARKASGLKRWKASLMGQLTFGTLPKQTSRESYMIYPVSSLLSCCIIVIGFGGVMARKRSQTEAKDRSSSHLSLSTARGCHSPHSGRKAPLAFGSPEDSCGE